SRLPDRALRPRPRGTDHVAIDMIRTRIRRPLVVPLLDNDVMDERSQVDDVLAHRVALHEALRAIAPRHRVAIVETVLRDRAPREVADELGIPAGTLRSRLHYGLREMRTLLERDDAA